MNMNTLHNDIFSYDPEEITITLLQQQLFSYSGPEADFNKQAIIDCLYWIKAAAENEKNAAVNYWNNKIDFNEYAAALLTALTPHKWNCCTLRGYCQREWINILYPADVYSDTAISEYECYFFGMYYEYNARYNGDNVTYYYSDNYTRDEIISYIAADFNAAPDQIIFNSCY